MDKPYPEFPLTAHRNGQLCKKINGRIHYFGVVDNWRAALEKYHSEIDYLRLGKLPPGSGTNLDEILNLVIGDKDALQRTGAITYDHFRTIRTVSRRVSEAAGPSATTEMDPRQWGEIRATLAARYAPTTLELTITVFNSMMEHARGMGYITAIPNTGPMWSVPSAKTIREHLDRKDRVVTPEKFAVFLAASSPQSVAYLMLGLNCAYGPNDLTKFSTACIKGDVATLVRSKTGANRQAVLWPETLAAIEGQFPVVGTAGQISKQMAVVMKPHSCYDLRHTFATIGDQYADSRAVDVVMCHSDGSIRATYRHGVEIERLRKLSEFVRERMLVSTIAQRSKK